MAENFASFDYKTQEEVLTVLKYLTSVLSTVGSQLVEALSPSHLLRQLQDLAPSTEQNVAAQVSSALVGGKYIGVSERYRLKYLHRPSGATAYFEELRHRLHHHALEGLPEDTLRH